MARPEPPVFESMTMRSTDCELKKAPVSKTGDSSDAVKERPANCPHSRAMSCHRRFCSSPPRMPRPSESPGLPLTAECDRLSNRGAEELPVSKTGDSRRRRQGRRTQSRWHIRSSKPAGGAASAWVVRFHRRSVASACPADLSRVGPTRRTCRTSPAATQERVRRGLSGARGRRGLEGTRVDDQPVVRRRSPRACSANTRAPGLLSGGRPSRLRGRRRRGRLSYSSWRRHHP